MPAARRAWLSGGKRKSSWPAATRVGTRISPSRSITLQPRIICPPKMSASGRIFIRHPPSSISRASRRRLNRWSYAGQEPDRRADEVLPCDPPTVEPPSDGHRLPAEPAPGEDLGRPLLRPPRIARGVEQDEARHALRIAKRVLQGDVAAERVAEHVPLRESELLPERVGVRGEVIPGHRRHRRVGRPPVAAMVIEDEGVPVREAAEGCQRHVVEPGPAMHEHAAADLARRLQRRVTHPRIGIIVMAADSSTVIWRPSGQLDTSAGAPVLSSAVAGSHALPDLRTRVFGMRTNGTRRPSSSRNTDSSGVGDRHARAAFESLRGVGC